VKEFTGTVGPRFNFMTGRFRPYGTVQIGFAYQNSDGMYARDHHPRLPSGSNTTESGFSYRMGGGFDFQVTDHLYWRVIEYDVQPQPWANNTPIYQNVGGGIGYRF
jgi:hypothetical protein